MIVGHYAAALVPYTKLEGRPLWLLLLCANVPEFLWLALALAGIEATTPDSILDATFPNLKVDMIYSHNLVPGLVQGAIVLAVVQAIWRDRALALWCGALTVVHVLCDLVVGFKHQLLGPTSPQVSLDTYGHMPQIAILLELLFALACIGFYCRGEARRGRPLSRGRQAALYAVFAIGILAWLPATTLSLRETLQQIGIAI
ncbi:MAG TPA: hypothetical protein VJM11_01295 [Nevskiaceae bacterium]|nr:hypothetical protein [Nevskiaceae bacterium]